MVLATILLHNASLRTIERRVTFDEIFCTMRPPIQAAVDVYTKQLTVYTCDFLEHCVAVTVYKLRMGKQSSHFHFSTFLDVNMDSSSESKPTNGGDVQSRLVELLSEARRDLLSQTGRVLPNLSLLAGVKDVISKGGQIDDRKYLVGVLGLVGLTSDLPRLCQMTLSLGVTSMQGSSTRCGATCAIRRFRIWETNSDTAPLMAPTTTSHIPNSVPQEVITLEASLQSIKGLSIFRIHQLFSKVGYQYSQVGKEANSIRSSGAKDVCSSYSKCGTDLFHTDEADRTRLRNSSYLDLGPLYGNNMDEQKRVRTFKDGLLKKDTFSESRFLSQPPGVCALVVAFNRFHNYIVQELATINERGRFSLPAGMTENDPDYSKAQSKRDNDLFQTGRLITCGLYINIILGDYLRTILNLNRNPIHSDWKLDPREDFDTVFDSEGTPRGIGNQVSVEFNMIYRWHSATSAQDEKWTNELFHKIFGPNVSIGESYTRSYSEPCAYYEVSPQTISLSISSSKVSASGP
ncbi:Uncharacterized protein HZ326_28676 [Fusarium oxysporum f. sp. albedinis]|nr:Uncharacterized protein HZ326_28676 [Fusarium oxysporum f. sp. albedinis]